MPARNRIKPYIAQGYYHVYNRGVEKRDIFLDTKDYSVFLSYLAEYLTPKDTEALTEKLKASPLYTWEKAELRQKIRLNNFTDQITMLSYCLMPNHFHFFIKQENPNAIDRFMNSLATRYSMYFNKKYKRVGSLYQGVYKAAPLTSEKQCIHLSAYIHKQAYKTQPSSYEDYLGHKNTPWVHPDEILTSFAKINPTISYEAFVKQTDTAHPSTAFPTLED